jgi:hypothetical protein
MVFTASVFVSRLTVAVPESLTAVREHLDDQDGVLLLHLLMADLRRLALGWYEEGQTGALSRLLGVVETALREGDEYVTNAIALSFVEDLGWWEPDMQPFIMTLPGELAKEVERQRKSSQ